MLSALFSQTLMGLALGKGRLPPTSLGDKSLYISSPWKSTIKKPGIFSVKGARVFFGDAAAKKHPPPSFMEKLRILNILN
jgi:hypothetical protein